MCATMSLVTRKQFEEVPKGESQENESEKVLNSERNQFSMDRFCDLPQDVLLRILSLLSTRDVIATSGVSKRWRSLWVMVPKLRFNDRKYDHNYEKFLHFVEKSLLLHKAPSLETLKLKLGPKCTADDVGLWMRLAVDRSIHELTVRYASHYGHIRLSRRIRNCKTLVVLKLKNAILDAISLLAGFISLRTLHLRYVKYSGDESPLNLLSSCHSLQELVVKRHNKDNVKRFHIIVRYLQSLTLYISPLHDEADSKEYVINTPNLKYLKIKDHCTDLCYFEDMPYLEEANLDVAFTNSEKFFSSLTSVEKLSLCLKKSKAEYPKGIIFSRLVHLELCTCDDGEWLNLLMHLLRDSPKLIVLKLNDTNHDAVGKDNLPSGDQQLSYVPECLTKSLEILEWRNFKGTFREMDLAAYILKNALCLKKLTVSPKSESSEGICDRQFSREDLASLFIASNLCEVNFG